MNKTRIQDKDIFKKLLVASLFISTLACFMQGCAKNRKVTATEFDYTLPEQAYQPRFKASEPANWKSVARRVETPVKGITLSEKGVFSEYINKNINYLLTSFSVNHMLYPFRERAGKEIIPDSIPQIDGWETHLRGASAGRFLMGAGNTLRWVENAELRARLNELIDGIEDCREDNGYILAYPHVLDSLRGEEPNYARAWFTHGLIEAAIAGNPKAYNLLRSHADYFNQWHELHPKLLHFSHNNHQGHIASTRTYLSPIGKPEDLQVAEKFYVCDWWLNELAARHEEAIWHYPLANPHCYLITSFEAYLDHYIATGDKAFLDATIGAWDMIHNAWEHVGGSIAICEKHWVVENGKKILKEWQGKEESSHPPHSNYLTNEGHTGETCGGVFWIKFNQRFHQLYPDEEKYMNEIEKSIYNVILSCQNHNGNIRYHAFMEGKKENPRRSENTCCEGQGTRMLGSLPEYIYSIADDGVYVNLYEPSSFQCQVKGQDVGLALESEFPYKPEVGIKVSTASPIQMKLRIRMPSWATRKIDVEVNGKKVATGAPGTYLALSRKWENNDVVRFVLPMELHLTEYHGIDEVAEGKRYAAEYGPILLTLTGSNEVPTRIRLKDSSDLMEQLVQNEDPLHYSVKGDSVSFVPYWSLGTGQPYTVFPIVEK
jgi:DUF1680 family protein